MNRFFIVFLCVIAFASCKKERRELSSIAPENWSKRYVVVPDSHQLKAGQTYLSVYPQIYNFTEHRKLNLTATISIRNINERDTIYLHNASFYDTHGQKIRRYFERSILIAPLETVEIIIDEHDNAGGSGANFLFDWSCAKNVHEPFFECVMISTSGQQGISFTTQGIRVK